MQTGRRRPSRSCSSVIPPHCWQKSAIDHIAPVIRLFRSNDARMKRLRGQSFLLDNARGTRTDAKEIGQTMWTVNEEMLERLAIGAGILGTGGGGNPYVGKLHAKALLAEGKTITVIPP